MNGKGGSSNMFWDGFQWINMVERKKEQDAVTRKLRRLYVGNLPMHLGLNPDMFRESLRGLMGEHGMVRVFLFVILLEMKSKCDLCDFLACIL